MCWKSEQNERKMTNPMDKNLHTLDIPLQKSKGIGVERKRQDYRKIKYKANGIKIRRNGMETVWQFYE